MPTETESMSAPHFEDALWQVLADAHRERQTGGGGRRGGPSGLVVQLGRRRGRRPVLVGASAAAAVATLVVALALRHDDGPPETVIDEAGVVILDDLLARVMSATQEAHTDMIVHGTMGPAGGEPDYEFWTDERSTAFRVVTLDDGEVSWDTHPATVPGDEPVTESVVVNYCTQEYSPVEPLPDSGPAALVLDMLAFGRLVEDGTEVVDGRELIRLVEPPAEDAPTADRVELDPETGEPVASDEEVALTTTTVWVDPHTYRPVRMDDGTSSRTYEYLPRTPENLAQFLSPPIPEGFTAVAALSNNSPDCR